MGSIFRGSGSRFLGRDSRWLLATCFWLVSISENVICLFISQNVLFWHSARGKYRLRNRNLKIDIFVEKLIMETFIIRGNSQSNAKLISELAKKLNFTVQKISESEAEELGIVYSIKEGLESGILVEEEKQEFIRSLKKS